MQKLYKPLSVEHGPDIKNRFMLAPLTNSQSNADGTLSDDEYHWLSIRAKDGFGLTKTCAAHVQARGQGFPGQLGIFDDKHIAGLSRLAANIRKHSSIAIAQLHHAGMRSPSELIGCPTVCPSNNERHSAVALTKEEVNELIQDSIAAAVRAKKSGFQGVRESCGENFMLGLRLSPERFGMQLAEILEHSQQLMKGWEMLLSTT